MAALTDLIKSELGAVYGSTLSVSDLIRAHYAAELGTPFPTVDQIRTLVGATSGQSINDALIAYFGTYSALFSDTFTRADGAIGNGWDDLAADIPGNHDPAVITSGRLGAGSDVDAKQIGVYRSLSLTDGVEITVQWVRGIAGTDPNTSDIGWQPGPMAFVDPAGDPAEIALASYYDVSLSGIAPYFACWGVFDGDVDTMGNYVNYDSNFKADGAGPALVGPEGHIVGKHIVRCNGDKIAGYFQRGSDPTTLQRIWGPIPVPAAFQDRDGWGAHNISMSLGLPNIGNIDSIILRPYSTDLGDYPATPTTPHVGVPVKAAAAASINVAYPANVAAGEYIIAAINSGGADISTPSGWTSIANASIAGGLRTRLFGKLATGTESGVQNFARASGTGNMGGVMFTVAGFNPVATSLTINAEGQNNPSSTDVPAPAKTISGLNRLVIWIGARGANVAITPPATYNLITELGTADATATNLSIASKEIDSSPQSSTGPIVGSIAAASTTNGFSITVMPDPR